ncbi:MAG: hypothetical protein ACYS17_04255, partial [Planctomycetota bacterium]
MNVLKCLTILVFTGLLLQSPLKAKDDATSADAMREMVEADWAAQERRKNRTPDATSAILDVYRRTEQLIDDLQNMPEGPDITSETVTL